MNKAILSAALSAAMATAVIGAASVASAATLDDVKAKGFVQCGVNTDLAGFTAPDAAGEWTGFDIDLCRAVASAIFNNSKKVKFTPLNAQNLFPAVQSGEVDVLARNTTWTISRDMALGLNFRFVNYYDARASWCRKA